MSPEKVFSIINFFCQANSRGLLMVYVDLEVGFSQQMKEHFILQFIVNILQSTHLGIHGFSLRRKGKELL